jgi:putative hemolysin
VLSLELGEDAGGCALTGLDQDRFDAVCDHLVVEDRRSRRIVGTYRLQPGHRARREPGFHSAQAFDLTPLESVLQQSVELGQACVDQAHRNLTVLTLLWKTIGAYAHTYRARYLFGCSSLNSVDARVGASVYSALYRRFLVALPFRVEPHPECECPLDQLCEELPIPPKLLRAYLSVGAKICGPPALDRQFGTIDFLTLLDLDSLIPALRQRFLPGNL